MLNHVILLFKGIQSLFIQSEAKELIMVYRSSHDVASVPTASPPALPVTLCSSPLASLVSLSMPGTLHVQQDLHAGSSPLLEHSTHQYWWLPPSSPPCSNVFFLAAMSTATIFKITSLQASLSSLSCFIFQHCIYRHLPYLNLSFFFF